MCLVVLFCCRTIQYLNPLTLEQRTTLYSAHQHRNWFIHWKLAVTFTILYDTVYLTCSKKLTDSHLSLPHEMNKECKRKKTDERDKFGPVPLSWRAWAGCGPAQSPSIYIFIRQKGSSNKWKKHQNTQQKQTNKRERKLRSNRAG